MIQKRKPSQDDTAALEKQRYIFGILYIAVCTLALCILLYVVVNLYLMISTDHAPNDKLGEDIFSSFLATIKLVLGVN